MGRYPHILSVLLQLYKEELEGLLHIHSHPREVEDPRFFKVNYRVGFLL
jgi:hypothetical protein